MSKVRTQTEGQISYPPFVSIHDRKELPPVAAVYVAFAAKRRWVLYVGSTQNLKKRFIHHHHADSLLKENARLFWVEIESSNIRRQTERRWIMRLRPRLNQERRLGYFRPVRPSVKSDYRESQKRQRLLRLQRELNKSLNGEKV